MTLTLRTESVRALNPDVAVRVPELRQTWDFRLRSACCGGVCTASSAPITARKRPTHQKACPGSLQLCLSACICGFTARAAMFRSQRYFQIKRYQSVIDVQHGGFTARLPTAHPGPNDFTAKAGGRALSHERLYASRAGANMLMHTGG